MSVALPSTPAPAQRLILEGYPSLEQQDVLGPNRGSRRWDVAEERKRVQAWTAVAAREQTGMPTRYDSVVKLRHQNAPTQRQLPGAGTRRNP